MALDKKEINRQIKELVGEPLTSLNGRSTIQLLDIDNTNDSVTFGLEKGKKLKKKLSYLRILVENLIQFPAINPAQTLGVSFASIKELVTLLANTPGISYFKYKSVIHLTIDNTKDQTSDIHELLPGEAEHIISKISKFESLDRKLLLKELVNVYNSLSLIEKGQDWSEVKPLIKQLKSFKDQNDAIFDEESNEPTLDVIEDQEDQFGDDYDEDDKKFDPSKLDIKTSTPTVDLLMSRIQHKEIILNPDFQRKDRIWKEKDKSALIESILLKIPIPVFYMSAINSDKWLIVDGLQRLTTIDDFMKDKFTLKGLDILTQYEGLKFSQFPRNLERRLRETEFVVHVIQPESPKSATTQIFQRINTKGEKLSDQEIRSSLNVGFATGFLNELAQSKEFINATNNKINPNRMKDIEYVLRFCAFYFVQDYSKVNIKTLDTFLTNTMVVLNTEKFRTSLIQKLESDFYKAMSYSRKIFDEYAFRKRRGSIRANTINKALFDTWSVCLAKMDESELNLLVERKALLWEKFEDLMDGKLILASWENESNFDKDFEFSISQSTSKNDMVRYRYLSIRNLIEGILKNDF